MMNKISVHTPCDVPEKAPIFPKLRLTVCKDHADSTDFVALGLYF